MLMIAGMHSYVSSMEMLGLILIFGTYYDCPVVTSVRIIYFVAACSTVTMNGCGCSV